MLSRNQRQARARVGLRDRAQYAMHVLIASQLAVAIVLTLALAGGFGTAAAYSTLVGAAIAIVPNYYLAGRLLRRQPRATAIESLRGIYAGELLKIVFTAALFVFTIKLLDVLFALVVAGYVAMVAINWLALLVIDLGEAPRSTPPDVSSSEHGQLEDYRIGIHGTGLTR